MNMPSDSSVNSLALVRERNSILQASSRWGATPSVSIDIGNDERGEFFDIAIKPSQLADSQVIDVSADAASPIADVATGRWKAQVPVRTRRTTLVCRRGPRGGQPFLP